MLVPASAAAAEAHLEREQLPPGLSSCRIFVTSFFFKRVGVFMENGFLGQK